MDPFYPIFKLPVLNSLGSFLLGMIITQRFSLHTSEQDGIFEYTETILDEVLEKLGDKKHLIGDQFTAADLTLACLLRPLKIVPYFFENPKYQPLFSFFDHWAKKYAPEQTLAYEDMLAEKRAHNQGKIVQRSPPSAPAPASRTGPRMNVAYKKKKGEEEADNDHQPLNILRLGALVDGSFLRAAFNYWSISNAQRLWFTRASKI